MPAIYPTIEELLRPGGSDRILLTDNERANNDTTRLNYTDRDKKILRQYKGGAYPAKRLCKVLQEKKNVWSYTLYFSRLTVQESSSDFFSIYKDIITNNHAADLRKRGEKSVLVRKTGVNIGDEITSNYLRVETMDPLIERYRNLYCRDLSERLGINERSLPPHLSFGVHMS